MIGLVIADDEQIIRQGLSDMPWNDIGVEVRGIASTGLEALELLRNTDSKIILTDIRMPDLDGIDLIHIIKDELPGIKAILLTGYHEFDYAYSAIKYNAFEFVLKPTDHDELLNIVKRAKEEVENCNKAMFNFNTCKTALRDAISEDTENAGHLPSGAINEIIDNVRIGNYHKVEVLTKEVLCCFSEDSNELLLKDVCKELAASSIRLLAEKGIEQFGMQDRIIFYNNINNCKSFDNLMQYTNSLMVKIMDVLNFNDDFSVNATVDECISYIEQYYMEDITLVSVAQHIHRNPIYISRLIKKVQGKNFSDILTCIRMNKACELLKNQDLKSYEVSDRVGIKDSRYFSQVFKKQFGVTPTEFRNNILLKYAKRDGEANEHT